MKISTLFFAASLLPIGVWAQENAKDTTAVNSLQEVVVTGQFEPQSIKKSVFNVRVISKEDMKNQAANNLADVLNQYLNISITPQSGTGRSTISMFGLDGRYSKILIDNMPLVTDGGVGNGADLTQINLDDIEQIEIIEGSMGVTHGANAVTGILNIITKKSSKHQWEIAATAQEETVGEEYKPFSQGRHIQNAKISHTITENWFASVGFNRNDFDGYLDDQEGKEYTGTDLKRGFRWLPKLQYLGNTMVSYQKGSFRAFYKFDYLNENIDYYNPSVIVTANPPFGENRYSYDKRYGTERIFNHLNFTGKLFQMNYNVSASYQKQTRETEDFEKDLNTGAERNRTNTVNQSTALYYSTGTVSNFFPNQKVDLQLGYEVSSVHGRAIVDGENQVLVPIEKDLSNYDFFVASEIKASDRFSIRPGMRFSFQSVFENQYATSLGLRYLLDNGLELRTSLGKSFRTPDFDELYSKIKFSGHQFYGNENLIPERSTSYDFSIKKTKNYVSGLRLANNLSASILDVDDKIDMAFVGFETDMSPIYQYINISKYKMWNLAFNSKAEYKNWSLAGGVSYVGVSRAIDNGETVSDDKFLYALQVNANLSYNWEKQHTQFSVYYKYNGQQQQFASVVENGQNVYRISEIDAYSFLDASVRRAFFKRQFEVTVGARNILDITRINQGIATGGAHVATNGLLLGYGRSYFLKLTYSLNL